MNERELRKGVNFKGTHTIKVGYGSSLKKIDSNL